mgnify:CR=1 FL=1
MIMKIFKLVTLVLLFVPAILVAQDISNEDKANKLFLQSVDAMNEENYEKALALLDQAIELDTNRTEFPYEKALAYYQLGKYKRCIHLLDSLKGVYDAEDILYRLLGNAYQMNQQPYEARKTYEEGMMWYPNSGGLYFELGVLELGKKKEGSALRYWTKGAKRDPYFADNYFMLTAVYHEVGDLMKSILYGELFINITNNTERIKQVSEFLKHDYDSLLKGINYFENFMKPIPINTFKKFEKRDSIEAFQGLFLNFFDQAAQQQLTGPKELSIAELIALRKSIIFDWYASGANNRFESALFDFQNELIKNGYFEVYNYLVFSGVLEEEAREYLTNNTKALRDFQKWFTTYDFTITGENNLTPYLIDVYRRDYGN